MNARVPQDVDLEDHLIYGLTPLRFVYLVVAVLAAVGVGRGLLAPVPVRALPCVALVATGATLAWGRWRGRPVDRWLLDAAVFAVRNYRLGRRRARARARARSEREGEAVIVPLHAINALPTRTDGPPRPASESSDLPPAA